MFRPQRFMGVYWCMFIRKRPFVGGLMADKQVLTDEHPVLVEADDVLARYGDVPVAYAVFRVKLNDDATEVADTEYVYTNNLYREWLGFGDIDLEGKSFLETIEDANTLWFPYCYRAVVLHEGSHDVVYSPEIDSWLSFNVEPSSMEGCCIFAFTKVEIRHGGTNIDKNYGPNIEHNGGTLALPDNNKE